MQVNYKTISSMEFDILTGTYKQVDKQVEDTSGGFADNAFFELLMNVEGQGKEKSAYTTSIESAFDTDMPLQDISNSEPLNNNLSSSLYALRFRQDEGLKAMEFPGQNSAEQLKNTLFSDLLSAL